MENIKISESLQQKVGNIHLGILRAEITVQDSPDELIASLNQEAASIRGSVKIEDIAKMPPVKATREAYKALGKKPARYRVSSEALLRRIVQGKGLYFINNVVDINNLISIRSGYGICLYDGEQTQGDITFRIAGAGETYRGIGKYALNLENLPVFADDMGPFGSPTSDSDRTMITPATKHILFIIVSFSDNSPEPWLDEAQRLLQLYARGANFQKQVISRG